MSDYFAVRSNRRQSIQIETFADAQVPDGPPKRRSATAVVGRSVHLHGHLSDTKHQLDAETARFDPNHFPKVLMQKHCFWYNGVNIGNASALGDGTRNQKPSLSNRCQCRQAVQQRRHSKRPPFQSRQSRRCSSQHNGEFRPSLFERREEAWAGSIDRHTRGGV